MKITTSVASTDEPIKLEEAKAHLRVDIADDDQLILNLVKAARENGEGWMGRALLSQTKVYYLDAWPDVDYIELPFPPLRSVSSIIYTDYNSVATTFSNILYIQDIVSEPGRIVLNYGQSWPIVTLNTVNPIAITYICGYSDVSAIPESIKQGMKIDISDMYEHREPRILGAGTMIEIPILSRLYSDYVDWTFKI